MKCCFGKDNFYQDHAGPGSGMIIDYQFYYGGKWHLVLYALSQIVSQVFHTIPCLPISPLLRRAADTPTIRQVSS